MSNVVNMFIPALEIKRSPQQTSSMFRVVPSTLQFVDFSIGCLTTQIITIHNMTQSPMDITIQFPPACETSFDAEFQQTNRVKPHGILNVSIVFLPQLNQKISGTVVVWFKCNRMSWKQRLLIACTPRTLKIDCEKAVIDFGRVVLGQSYTLPLVVLNQSAIPLQTVFRNLKGYQLSRQDKLSEEDRLALSQLDFKHTWELSQVKTQVPIKYLPQALGTFQFKVQLNILNQLDASPVKITIKGECVKVPIYLPISDYDMFICIIGHTYKHKINLYNRSMSQLKIEVTQPEQTKRYIEFTPSTGFVPTQSHLDIWFTLHIFKDIVDTLQHFRNGDTYTVPFKVTSQSQTMPVTFRVQFKITTDKLTISPMKVDFGNIYGGTGSKVFVSLKNESLLLQQIMLFPSCTNIRVVNEQPIQILPQEELSCQLLFITGTNIDHRINRDGVIKCNVITGNVSTQEIKLNTTCHIIKPQLQLQESKINLPVLQIDETYSTQIKIKNNSQQPLVFQIFLPPEKLCGITMCPLVKVLASMETFAVNVQYRSFMKKLDQEYLKSLEQKSDKILGNLTNYVLNNKAATFQSEEAFSGVQEYIQKLGGKYSYHNGMEYFQWLIPVYFKQKENPDASAEVTFLEVSTTSVQKSLAFREKGLDFGQVPVGSVVTRVIHLENNSECVEFWKTPLPIWCGFKVVNLLKSLKGYSCQKIVVQFSPHDQRFFIQKLTIHSEQSQVSAYLKGTGVRLKLSIIPQSGLLNMGCLMPGQVYRKHFVIKNEKPFRTAFKLKTKAQGVRNLAGFQSLSFIPSQGFIQPNDIADVEVVFRPETVSDRYFQFLHILVSQQKQIPLYVWGECKSHQGYVTSFEQRQIPFAEPLQNISSLFTSEQVKGNSLVLVFDQQPKCNVKKVRIGNCRDTLYSERRVSFKILIPQSPFHCDIDNGLIDMGEQITVTFEYVVPEHNNTVVLLQLHSPLRVYLAKLGTGKIPVFKQRQLQWKIKSQQSSQTILWSQEPLPTIFESTQTIKSPLQVYQSLPHVVLVLVSFNLKVGWDLLFGWEELVDSQLEGVI